MTAGSLDRGDRRKMSTLPRRFTTCRQCSMSYCPDLPEDRRLHTRHHATVVYARHATDKTNGSVADATLYKAATIEARAVFCDFETRNTGGCALERAGAWRYATDPKTEILTLVYRDGAEPRLWTPAAEYDEPLKALAADPGITFVCFAGFEQAIWQHLMVERHGFAPIPVARWTDMQAVCSYFALPRSLGKVLPVLGAPVVKDQAGKRLVRSLSRPNRKTGLYPEVTSEILERVHRYNGIDVDGLIAIHSAVGELPEQERRVWELDQRINRRGLGIDVELVCAAKIIAEHSTGVLLEEFAELTDGLSPYQIGKTREWLAGRGFGLGDLQEATVQEALDDLTYRTLDGCSRSARSRRRPH
jgi:DNA polymerase bacteriophage-type